MGHNGIDIGVAKGSKVFASAAGKIKTVVMGSSDGRGNYIVIEHFLDSSSSYYSVYQHLDSISKKVGDTVNAGDVIGLSGDSGSKGQAHLHLGILIGAKDYTQKIGTMEGAGWFLYPGNQSYLDRNTKSGKTYGRVLNNPSIQTYNAYSFNIAYPGALEEHCGSVTYTFDKGKVSVGKTYNSFTPAAENIAEGLYKIRSSGGLYLNALSDSNGGEISASKATSSEGQVWNIKKMKNTYSISAKSSPSGRVFNVYTGTSSMRGDKLTLWEYTGDGSQCFVFSKADGGAYTIHPQDNTGLAVTSNIILSHEQAIITIQNLWEYLK